MKTLLYTTDYPPNRGGVARYLQALVAFFGERIVVRVVPKDIRWWTAAWKTFCPGQDKMFFDQIMVSHVLPLGTAAMVSGWFTRKPYIVIVHGMDVGMAKRNWTKRFVVGLVLRQAKLVVANSRALETEVRKDFGVTRTIVVYPCLEIPIPGLGKIPRPGIGVGEIKLLTVARLVPRKGHLRVLDALDRLRRKHPELKIVYTIVGDGPMRAAIESRLRELQLTNVTIVPDATDGQLAAYYASADIFIMPVVVDSTDREGFGMVYLEAAAYGVPSIATKMPGVDEAVLDGETGLLVPDGDLAALAEAVYRLATDGSLRHRLGEAAGQRAASEFTCKTQLSKLEPLL
jgi:glycosyltransferase involved in cell wall biosynthesis